MDDVPQVVQTKPEMAELPAPASKSSPRSGSETRKRSSIVGFRASVEEKAEVELAAERAGLTVSSYVRAQTLAEPKTRATRRPPIERELMAQAVALLGRAAGSLYQIARHLNFGNAEAAADVEAALAEVREAISLNMAATGQQPKETRRADKARRKAA